MTSSLYISTTEPGSGKALLSLGIIEMILHKTTKVGFFRPIIAKRENGKKDEDIDLIVSHFNLQQTYTESFGLFDEEANDLIGDKKHDEVLEKIIAKYKNLEQKCDFILCEGSDYLSDKSAFEFNLNTEIAKNLGCPILILGNAYKKSLAEAFSTLQIALESYQEEDCQIIGIVVNKVAAEIAHDLYISLFHEYKNYNYLISVIPVKQKLISPNVKEIVEKLKAEVLYGHERLNSLVSNYLVAAMQMQHAITWLKEETLVITPGDRGDIIIGFLQAHKSSNYPNLSGILLSTGLKPDPSITKLIDGLHDPLPILSVKTDTYETISLLHDVHSSITPDDNQKIDLSIKTFNDYVDLEKLESQINTIKAKGITPKMFTYNLLQQAKSQKRHIVLPEGDEPRILQAASVLLAQQIVELTILGKREKIEYSLQKHQIQLDLKRLKIINPVESDKFEEYAHQFYELRKHKGMTEEAAKEYLMDVSFFGTMMVYAGDADGMVSGAVHTTGQTIRPALQLIKTKPGFSIVSSVFFMCLEDRVLVYGDCAVNPDPTAEQLAEIAITSAETAQTFGIEPIVALLSYSSGTSGEGEDVEKVREATKIAKERRPDLKLEGPIQYDAAVDPTVADQKMPGSVVAGKASVFIFPDLNTGNNTYKAVQRETGAIAIGPILQGLKKPVNDLSRGCTVADIVNTVAITAIQSP